MTLSAVYGLGSGLDSLKDRLGRFSLQVGLASLPAHAQGLGKSEPPERRLV